MNGVALLGLAVVAPLITGLLTLVLPRHAIAVRTWLATAGPAIALALVAWHALAVGVSDTTAPEPTGSIAWLPSLDLNLAFLNDGLGTFFALLIAGVGVLINLYARAYFGPEPDDLYRFYPTLGFFTTAMLGIVVADYLLLTLLFWEMTSISSFLLIGWDRFDKKAVKLGMQAFFTTALGGIAMLGGLLLLSFQTDIWRWSELMAAAPDALELTLAWDNAMLWAFVLIYLGAATKSAQFPWHYWLPGAMAAPTPVSAFLHSATMVKAGVFLAGRMFPAFAAMEIWPWLLIPFGAVTMLLGAAIALNQHDLKRIFAYTTVSQLGLLMCMYGLGSIDWTYQGQSLALIDWDITQIANHAFYKAPLFILAGALGHVASRQLPELFGAVREHKAMVVVMLLAGYGLAALPGSISFQAKELFIYAIYHATEVHPAFWLLMAMTVLTAVFNVAIFTRLVTTLLGLGPGMRPVPPAPPAPDEENAPDDYAPDHPAGMHTPAHGHGLAIADDGHDHHEHHHETGFWGAMLWVPGLILVLPQFIGGLITPAWNAVFAPLESNLNYFADGVPALWQISLGVPLLMSVISWVGGAALGLSPLMRGAITDVHDRVYPGMYWLAVEGGGKAFRVVQTGNFHHYTVMVLCAFLLAFAGSLYVEPEQFATVYERFATEALEFWPGMVLGVIVVFTALILPLPRRRMLRVLILGTIGFSVVGLYLVYQAPDLALTQLMFEIISVILFVLVLRLLPDVPLPKLGGKVWRIGISAAVGLAFGWATLVAASNPMEQPVGGQLAAHSYDGSELTDGRGGGGFNAVNVTLVDFRGMDTFGEIAVLMLAALGVWSLIPVLKRNRYAPKLGGRKEDGA